MGLSLDIFVYTDLFVSDLEHFILRKFFLVLKVFGDDPCIITRIVLRQASLGTYR